jgi:hypothetical protein
VNEVIRVGVGQRGEPGSAVAEHLGGHAAQAEHHQRPEHGLLDDAHLRLKNRR